MKEEEEQEQSGNADSEMDKEAAKKAAVEDQAKEEAEEKYEKALNSWKDACLPLKLSIEVVTNAFTVTGGDDGGYSQNDDYDGNDVGLGIRRRKHFGQKHKRKNRARIFPNMTSSS